MQELLTEHNGGNGAGHHHRRWRRRNIRMLRPILETNRDNLFGQGFVSSGLGSRMRSIEGGRGAISNEVIAKDRLTLLTDPEDFNAPQISASNVANADSGGDAADDEAISSNHIVSLRALNSANRETILPIIPSQVGASNNGELENPTRMNSEQQQFTNQSMRNNLMMMLNPSERRDLPMQDKPLYQYHQNLQQQQQPIQSSWSSTTALLILLICYIIWQCFRGQNKQRKCLDDWPTLLTPSRGGSRSARRGSRQSFDETCELQTVGQPVTTTTATTTTSAASEVANKNRSKNSAILRVKCDNRNDETEVEIIHADGGMPSNCDDGRTTIAKPNNTGIRKSLMRKSLVIAANRAARPRVKLISEKMRRFVDIEAQSDNQATGKVSLANRLVSLLQISGLVKRPLSSNEACSQSTARDAADQETDQKRQDERMTTNVPKALEQQQQQQQAEISPNPDTIEVIIHQNLANSSSSSESLLGFAGSFLEPTINPVAAAADANPKTMESSSGVPLMNRDPSSSRQHNRLPSDSPSNHVITCSNSESNPQISPTTPSSLVNNNKSQLDSPQHELLLGPPCDCALARSKSQTCQSYCQAQVMNRLLTTANTTTSPANIRPCCSVSPSAMSRHENASHQFVQHHQHHHPSAHHHHHPEASLFRPTAAAAAAMGVQNSHCAIYCGNNRAKHHYENYYDDEQEDAYRRLTASIGVQFGLAMEQQNSLMPETQATCSMACHCNSSPTRQSNIIIDGAIGGPLRGDLSLGDSDSGNFSLINNKQRNNSDSICNDSNCSLCQSSLLTTTAPSQQTINMFVGHHPVSLDPIGIGNGPNQQGSPLVSRWHSRRRSALYSRQPRRMSIAGVACQQFATNGYGSGGSGGGNPSTPQHFLHRASIASDGTNGFHQHHHHPAAKQIAYPPAHFCASNKQKSSYSSSAGSSSGIGFSGSQCLNTPTTGAFPYQSFAITKPFTNTDLVANGGCVQAANQSSLVNELQQQQQTTTAAWHLATATAVSTSTGNHQHQVHNCINYKTPALSSSTSRKFSLPVQLECETTSSHHLMMTSSNYQNDLLFFNQQQQQAEHDDDVSTKHSLPSVSPFCRPIQSPNTVSHPIIDGGDSLSSIGVGSLTQKSIEQNRRSSQTITRQSSFWLEDTNLEPAPATLKQTMDNLNTPRHTDVGQPQMIAQECENKTIDPISQERAREFIRPVSSSPELPETPFDEGDEQQQHDKFGPGGASSSTTKSSANRRIQHSSSSSTSSPSPDFHRRHNRQRLSNRTSQSSSITKRRFLKSLKQRRAQRQQSSANSVHRRNGPQASSPLADQKQDTISTDDERDKTKQDDGLSSFDREVANAVSGRTIPDINSTSLERQCRDLWKLRATLHDDALVGDNWSNYHQRLNRRYDSGYKSIENQFSSSIEGNIPSILSLSLHQVSVTNNNENDLHELGRPQSGCSGMIQEQAEESSRNVASSILNEEETQALLDNCDDQQDEQ